MILIFLLFSLLGCYSVDFDSNVLLEPAWKLDKCPLLNTSRQNSCPMCDASGKCTIHVAVILTASDYYIVNTARANATLREAEIVSRTIYGLLDNVDIDYQFYDDGCTQEQASGSIIDAMMYDTCIHVIFGPMCEYCLATIGRMAKYLDVPLITSGGFSLDFTKQKTSFTDEMFLMVNSGLADFRSYSEFLHIIFKRYEWNKVVLMYQKNDMSEVLGDSACHLFMSNLISEIQNITNLDYVDGDLAILGSNYTDFLINKVGVDYGIVITCASQPTIRRIIIDAANLKMMDKGEYTFFNLELYNNAPVRSQPWYLEDDTEENNKLAKKGYQSVYTFLPYPETNFEQAEDDDKKRGSLYLDGLYDGMIMYTQALTHSLEKDESGRYINQTIFGSQMVYAMMGKTFIGKYNETIQMNCNAQRVAKYALLNINSEGVYETVGIYSTSNKTVEDWNLTWPFGIPSDIPKCGYDMSKCPSYNMVKILVICLISVTVAGLIIVFMILYRQMKLRHAIEAKAWKVSYKEILFLPAKSRASFQSITASIRGDYDGLSVAGDKQLYATVGFYKSMRVAVKHLRSVKIQLNRKELYELKVMKDLSHDNLVKFHGACVEGPNCLLTEYCPRGSLQDILENEQVKLEWTFRLSLIYDLVRGMCYLHHSPIKTHGALKSSNCLVDNRFALKIADFGLHFLRVHDNEDDDDEESHSYWKKQLWTAPELLRTEPPLPCGTQKGDVYSFGIIMHEIVMRKGVFYLEDRYMDIKEIVETVKKGTDSDGTILRPTLSSEPDKVVELINKCWAEDSVERPDFTSLKDKLHQISKEDNQTHNGNLLDNLLARMEQYADNLETLVAERTADYREEKRKCEELLYQLLPKSVAQQLIHNSSVIAENYDSVTIYFSDIVGFTALSAESTAFDVVNFLNDLYTCFDQIVENFDVYKVETIGDAYMVASGLPERNGNKHAVEIARMSLALLGAVKDFKIVHKPKKELELRIGIHTGPCVAGVVGTKMPRYCLFGDTVNTASRMESNGLPLKIHVSPTTKAVLDTFGTFDLECRGRVEMKGKGTMTTYWLTGERAPKVTISPGPMPTLESRVVSIPTTPVPANVRKEMANNGKINMPEEGIPLLALSSLSESEPHSDDQSYMFPK